MVSVEKRTQAKKLPIPKFLWLLASVELWERFSFYGMRALLVLYLISFMKMTEGQAFSVFSLFGTFSYIACVMFGYLADKFLGARNTVKIGGVVMLFGHGLMALSHIDGYSHLVFLALSLICVGTSAFKGNITNMLGMCYKGTPYSKDAGYTIFYVAVNVGSFLAILICGKLGQSPDWGWGWGFGIAGAGMLVGLITLQVFESLNHVPEYYQRKYCL